ncbi:uncharacterized protein FFMR_02024 [Fusarium fujikuroi]|nr:uncharacterized protein FFMR_02024 [Fusarium fujikuroi]
MHTIAIDFITDLPPVPSAGSPWAISGFDLYDQLMTVTCAASKRCLLVPGYSMYTAEDWAIALSRQLLLADWGIPKVIISDRDRKFTSAFWRKLWEVFGCKLVMTTAYHPEADGLSEWRNQMVEVALRFYYIEYPLSDWSYILPALQWNLNGAHNAGTGTSAHEFIYGFKPMSALDTVTPMEDVADLPYLREVTCKEARLAMDFAAMKGKRWYDDKHRPITLKQGDRVYLRLHDGYHLPGKPSKKWSQQRTGPFLIKRVVNDLAYELEIPEQWKIYPVISVKYLVPAYADDHIDEQPGPVEGELVDENRYEADFIVKREVRRRGRNATPFEGFLVRWKGWGPEHD